jgi:putative glycosyltransferase (TIGR04372 family)
MLSFVKKFKYIIEKDPEIIFFFPIGFLFLVIILFLNIFINIRIGFLHSDRLGHFAANTELYLCLKKKLNINSIDLFYLDKKISNKFLLTKWKEIITILPRFILRPVDLLIRATFLKKILSCNYIYNSDRDIFNCYEDFAPNIFFSKKERSLIDKFNRKFNIKKNSKIVCINVRDSAYLDFHYNSLVEGHDFSYHNFRDSNVENFKDTILMLLDKGYHVFRVGTKVVSELNINNPRYFDKDYRDRRDDFSDVYLASICNFCISTGSGFDALVRIFRNPILFVDLIPLGYYHSFCCHDLTISKSIYFKNKKLRIRDIIKKDFLFAQNQQFYSKKNLKIKNNSSAEILYATKEMINALKNRKYLKNKHNSKNQVTIDSLIENKCLEHNLKLHGIYNSSFSKKFLKNNL